MADSKLVYFKQLDWVSFFGKIHAKVKDKITWSWEFDKELKNYTGKCLVEYKGRTYVRSRNELYNYLSKGQI